MGEAIVWWVAIQLLGLAAVPIAAVLLRALPDRGYSMSKALGLLLAGWLAYTLAMAQALPFGRLSMALCLLAVGAFSLWLLLRNGRALLMELRAHFSRPSTIRYIAFCEALFAIAYIMWAIVRAYQPSIVDQEKFMDFGFLNSILKSGAFPPNDMWLAGHSINYYYFGYVLMAGLTALSGVPTQIAFNLANVTLFALTALGSFGVVYNLISSRLLVKAARRQTAEGRRQTTVSDERRKTKDESPARNTRSTIPNPKSTQPVPTRRARSGVEASVAVGAASISTHTGVDTLPEHEAIDTSNGPVLAAEQSTLSTQHSALSTPRGPAYLPMSEAAVEMRRVPFFLSPYVYGVIAALMVVLMGNLSAAFATKTADTLEGNGFRFCILCNQPQSYDWFGASRIIQDYRTTQAPGQAPQKVKVGFETINEFPAFSFLLADMHPHVIALPFVLLLISASMALIKRRVVRARSWRDGLPPGLHAWASLLLVGLIAGSLYTINTWDFPTYLVVVLLCLGVPYLAASRRSIINATSDNPQSKIGAPYGPPKSKIAWLLPYIVQAAILVVSAIVAFIPFHLTFKSLVGGQTVPIPENLANLPIVGGILQKLGELVLINDSDKTITGFLVIFGIFLVALLVWLGYEFAQYTRRRALTVDNPSLGLYIWGAFLVVTWLVAFLLSFPLLALLLPVAAVSLALVWREPRRSERNFALILVAVAALIGLVIEVVFLRDNFQTRMNTLFKFYFQIWILWALAAGYALWRVLYAAFGERAEVQAQARSRDRDRDAYYAPSGNRGVKAMAGVWAVAFLLLVASGLLYSYYGVMRRQVLDGGQTLHGLDGTAWLQAASPGDYDAINWLKQNGTGKDVVLEAGHDEYSRPGRVSSYTGVPTLVGWDNSHESLWRTNQPELLEQIRTRRSVVNAIYQGTDPNGGAPLTAQRLLELLKQYSVDYVFVGDTEHGVAGAAPQTAAEEVTPYAESVFKYALAEAFRSGNTVIYKVGENVASNGALPATPVAGVTPGAPGQFDPNVPPIGLFQLGAAGANRGQFNLPRGIARDAAGDFYVADTQNERIQKFDKDGKWLSMFGSKGNGDGQFNPFDEKAVGTGPGGVAVDAAGNIYVADTWNHRIQKFDSAGKFLTKWGDFISLADPQAANDPDKTSKFYGPRGVAIGPEGNVYVTDTGNKRVSIFDPNGKFVREISSGVTPEKNTQNYPYNKQGELNEPIGIAVDNASNVYVADTHNNRIDKFDKDGKFAAAWDVPSGAWNPGPYLEPFLALDGAGNIYATAPTSKTVLKYSPTGQLLGQKNGNGTLTLRLPTGIAVDGGGTVYVVDTDGNGVLKLGAIP